MKVNEETGGWLERGGESGARRMDTGVNRALLIRQNGGRVVGAIFRVSCAEHGNINQNEIR